MSISAELKSQFLRLYKIAISDDKFSPIELKLLYQFAEERDIPKAELDSILLSPHQEEAIPENVDERVEFLYDLARMIIADGLIHYQEKEMLIKYCKKFEFIDENIEELTNYLLESAKAGKSNIEIIKELNN